MSADGRLYVRNNESTLLKSDLTVLSCPDHGRMIWDEVAMPGYGLYDRALGATYLNGLWEAIEKSQNNTKKAVDSLSTAFCHFFFVVIIDKSGNFVDCSDWCVLCGTPFHIFVAIVEFKCEFMYILLYS